MPSANSLFLINNTLQVLAVARTNHKKSISYSDALFLYKKQNFIKTECDQNIHKCIIFQKFLGGPCPQIILAKRMTTHKFILLGKIIGPSYEIPYTPLSGNSGIMLYPLL